LGGKCHLDKQKRERMKKRHFLKKHIKFGGGHSDFIFTFVNILSHFFPMCSTLLTQGKNLFSNKECIEMRLLSGSVSFLIHSL
jgi:hypothetical protein